MVISDGTAASSVIEAVVDLTGSVTPTSGILVAAENTFILGAADLTTNLIVENSDNVTHLLVLCLRVFLNPQAISHLFRRWVPADNLRW